MRIRCNVLAVSAMILALGVSDVYKRQGVYIGRDPVPRSVGGASVWEGTSQFLTQAQFNLRIDLFI